MKRDEVMKVHVTKEEKEEITKNAEKKGLSASGFLRNQSLNPGTALSPTVFAEVNENLKQIAKRHNDATQRNVTRIYILLGASCIIQI
ncbi:MAG: hypothetical protein MR407_07375 [Roseburia sp.]|nr:hypothetical protein [Roseburia sp.]